MIRPQIATLRRLSRGRPLPLIRLGLFVLTAMVGLSYLLVSVIGVNAFSGTYAVHVELPVTGGLLDRKSVV